MCSVDGNFREGVAALGAVQHSKPVCPEYYGPTYGGRSN
jgi:hypothetical protein